MLENEKVVDLLDEERVPFSLGAAISEFCASILETDDDEADVRLDNARAYLRRHLGRDTDESDEVETGNGGSDARATKRQCVQCRKYKGFRAFDAGGDTCRSCQEFNDNSED